MRRLRQGSALFCVFSLLLIPMAGTAQTDGEPSRPTPARVPVPASAPTDPKPRILEQFPIHNDGDFLLVPVTLGGKTYPFVLDTGATLTFYDVTLRPQLGNPVNSQTIHTVCGTTKLEVFNPPGGTLGKLALPRDEFVACCDLAEQREASGHEIYGILGMDFLKSYVITIDFDHATLGILDSVAADAGASLPLFDLEVCKPSIYAQVAGLGLRKFVLDTAGHGPGDLRAADFDEILSQRKLELLGSRDGVGLSKSCRFRYGIVEEVKFGEFRHTKLVFRDGKDESRGSLGLRFLRRYNVTFNFPNEVVYLKKSRSFGVLENDEHSGMTLRRKAGHVVVESVDEGSPAAKAGVRQCDSVLKVDGLNPRETRLHVVAQRLSSPGRTILLTIQRKDRVLEVPLILPTRSAAQHGRR